MGTCSPIKKADLLPIAQYVVGNLPYNLLPVLAKRHKIDTEKNGASPNELLAKHVKHSLLLSQARSRMG